MRHNAHKKSAPGALIGGLVSTLGLCGCTSSPMIPLFGAYFPGWLLCAVAGVLAAVGLRVLFVMTGVDAILSYRLFTYVALGAIFGFMLWSIWFGP